MGLDHISGRMEEFIKDRGRNRLYMGWGHTNGLMANSTKENTEMTKKRDLAFILYKIIDNMKAGG